MYGETTAFDAISWRFNHLPEARRRRRDHAQALARAVDAGRADVRADEVLPGDVIRLAGNAWVVQDARLGAAGICFLSTLGGHMHACERSHRVKLLSSPANDISGRATAARPRRRALATQRRVAA
jgi:hypothetical protein